MLVRESINESIKHLTPRSEQEIQNIFIKDIKKFKNSLDTYELKDYPEFRKISNLLNLPLKEMFYVSDMYDAYSEFNEFAELMTKTDKPTRIKAKETNTFFGGTWLCYPREKLAYWICDDFNIPTGWIFNKKHFINRFKKLKTVNESIKHLTGRSEQELQAIFKNLSPQEKLETGVEQGIIWLVKDAIAAGANVHARNDGALRWASIYGHTEVVKLLLDAGADVHAQDDDALQWASYNGHAEVVRLLLAAGADVHAGDDAALRYASSKGYAEVVKLLKQHMKKKINESIKHLTGRSQEEIQQIKEKDIRELDEILKKAKPVNTLHLDIVKLNRLCSEFHSSLKNLYILNYFDDKTTFNKLNQLIYDIYEEYPYSAKGVIEGTSFNHDRIIYNTYTKSAENAIRAWLIFDKEHLRKLLLKNI